MRNITLPVLAYLGTLVIVPLFASAQSNVQEVAAPWCGEFLPMITEEWIGAPHRRVHYVAKYCNQIMVNGSIEKIPPGVGVLSGGVHTDVTNTCVDKVCGRPLKPNMLYRAYVYKDGVDLKINFSVTEHKEGPYGNEVHAEDPTQSFIGLIATEETGRVCGGMSSLCILSWFYRGHTGIGDWIGPEYGRPVASTCAANLQPIETASVKVLTFGINSTFRQGYTVPNIYATGTVANSEPEKPVQASISIEWGGTPVKMKTGTSSVIEWSHYANASIQPGTAISFYSDGSLPTPLIPGDTYFVHSAVDVNNFTLTDTPGGAPLAFGGQQSGMHIVVVRARGGGPKIMSGNGVPTPFQAVAIGGLGAEEGWLRGTLMLSAPEGGCATVPNGMIYTSPHHS